MTDLSSVSTDDLIAEIRIRLDQLTLPSDPTSTIEQLVADEFNLTTGQLHNLTRTESIALPRQVAMTLMREAGCTWQICAGHFGLDHGTAIHAAKTVATRITTCTALAARVHRLRSTLATLGFQPLGRPQTSV